jgi:peptidoglycan/xylan/chitin deacetylase (PgdA/CDA1 family)
MRRTRRPIGNIPVLVYHRILAADSPLPPECCGISSRDFQDQLQRLDRWGMTPVTFRDIRLAAADHLTLPLKPLVLTFDGGSVETFTHAYPVLQQFGMTGVIFVPADLDSALPAAGATLMDSNQVLELHEAGFEIGSYSLTGRPLTVMPPEQAWDEISRSRMNLEILLNTEVRSFAYPDGLMSDRIVQMVREAGYHQACALRRAVRTGGGDALSILRVRAADAKNPLLFAWSVRGKRHGQWFELAGDSA